VATESLELQRQQATAAAQERSEAKKAYVAGLSWGIRSGHTIQNLGRGAAKNVRVLVHHYTGPVQLRTRSFLAPNERVGLIYSNTQPTEDAINSLPERERTSPVICRIIWTNEDDTPGDSGWHSLPHETSRD
jgi:hypothetical protein